MRLPWLAIQEKIERWQEEIMRLPWLATRKNIEEWNRAAESEYESYGALVKKLVALRKEQDEIEKKRDEIDNEIGKIKNRIIVIVHEERSLAHSAITSSDRLKVRPQAERERLNVIS